MFKAHGADRIKVVDIAAHPWISAVDPSIT
jgi:hypothetical protein